MKYLPHDTIAWRFGLTIAAALAVTCTLIGLFYLLGGVWARPPIDPAARLEGAEAVINIVEKTPYNLRKELAEAINTHTYRADWYPEGSETSLWLDRNYEKKLSSQSKEISKFSDQFLNRKTITITPSDPIYTALDFPLQAKSETYYFSVELKDRSWLVFKGHGRYWGLDPIQRLGVWFVFLLLAVIVVSAFATHFISQPVKHFASAIKYRGINKNASPLPEAGPQELRDVIVAFNEMQVKVQEFISYRTDMLAAISHDLRTPLTRMRLRGEYIEDETQRERLFRDVHEMQTMIDGALAFFKGDSDAEETRIFDLADILQSITEDFADQNISIVYSGPERLFYVGRALALKRAFTNLIDNAVKYATPPEVNLLVNTDTIAIFVRDKGPGIPEAELEKVFRPFYRLDRSRNRASGGVGLGLTAAQAIIRSHGGNLHIRRREEGGLEVVVLLPKLAKILYLSE